MDTSYIPTGNYYIREVEYCGVDRVMMKGNESWWSGSSHSGVGGVESGESSHGGESKWSDGGARNIRWSRV